MRTFDALVPADRVPADLVPADRVTADRVTGRAEVGNRGLSAYAAERVVRVALDRLPVPLIPRVTSQLRRFFSTASWSTEDDSALAAAVGPGRDWFEDELEPDIALAFGWRGGSFRVEVTYTPAEGSDATSDGDTPSGPQTQRTLGDTFEDPIVVDIAARPDELRFGIGPTPGPSATFTRDNPGSDSRVAVIFRECPDVQQITIGAGTLAATVADATRWAEILLPLFDVVRDAFVPERPAPPDRQAERAQRELGPLHPDSPRDLARIIDATTSPDAAFRRLAMERLADADATTARAPWRRGLEDSSRAVRRSTARVLAATASPATRDLLERALADADACVRYYAVTGLAAIGLSISLPGVEAKCRDTDVRVRLTAESAVSGRVPA